MQECNLLTLNYFDYTFLRDRIEAINLIDKQLTDVILYKLTRVSNI